MPPIPECGACCALVGVILGGLGWLLGRSGGSDDRGLLRESLRDAEADLDAADQLNRCLMDLLADTPETAARRAQVHAAFLKKRGGR